MVNRLLLGYLGTKVVCYSRFLKLAKINFTTISQIMSNTLSSLTTFHSDSFKPRKLLLNKDHSYRGYCGSGGGLIGEPGIPILVLGLGHLDLGMEGCCYGGGAMEGTGTGAGTFGSWNGG